MVDLRPQSAYNGGRPDHKGKRSEAWQTRTTQRRRRRRDDLLGKVDRLAAAQDALAARIDALTAPAVPRIEGTASGLSAVPIPPAPDGPLFNLDAVGELG